MFAHSIFDRSPRNGCRPYTVAAILIACALPNFAKKSLDPTFPSPEAAAATLYSTVRSNNERFLKQLIGKLASSGDPAEDKVDRLLFLHKYEEMHRLVQQAEGTMVLYIGAENWPFPVPLVPKDGVWRFGIGAGAQEVMFRHIGENENHVIRMCQALGQGSNENGPATDIPHKLTEGSAHPVEGFYGYVFRKLPKDGSFVAYPARYGSTGIMTFAITEDGAVYEKDLGRRTPSAVKAMAQYKRDQSWHLIEQ